MTTRRNVLTLASAAALLSGCRDTRRAATRPAAPRGPEAPELLLADTSAGLALIGAGHRAVLPAAVATPGGGAVYAAEELDDASTALVTIDTTTGRETGRSRLAGRWAPRITSGDGTRVVLAPPGGHGPRDHTPLAIVGRSGVQQTLDVPGNVEPDAFAADGTALFVLEWLPALAPERYRVRALDLASGVPQPLNTRDKQPLPPGTEEEMRGTGRHSMLSPGREILYTLYTHQPDHQHTRDLIAGRPGGVHAFVHVLHLAARWAYCLDLPAPFGHGPAEGHTMALTPDGLRLFVADLGAGRLAAADTGQLTVSAVTELSPVPGPAGAAVSPDGRRLFLAAGRTIQVRSTTDGSVTATWDADAPTRGLGVSPDGARLYVGTPTGITWLSCDTGMQLGRVPVDGLTALRQVVAR